MRIKHLTSIIIVLAFAASLHFISTYRNGDEEESGFPIERVRLMFPGAVGIKVSDTEIWSAVVGEKGRILGFVVTTEGYSDHITGYGGPTPLLIGSDKEGKISGVVMLDNNESSGFIDEVISNGLMGKWDGLSWRDAATVGVDTITGATITSQSVIGTIRHRLSQVKGEELSYRTYSWVGDIFTLVLCAIALFVCLKPPKRYQLVRTIILAVSVIYLGFFRGEFLSIKLIEGWVTGSVALKTTVALAVIAAVSIAILIARGTNLYCSYLCPFGALQELVHKVSPRHVQISKKLYKWLEKIKTALLILIAVLLILNVSIDLTGVEPFTAFLIRSAEKSVIIMALIALAVSLFVYRPWCSFLCPTGAFFELFKKKKY